MTSFRSLHPHLVVCSASRASKLCLAATRDTLAGLISIADPHQPKRPPRGVFDALPSLRLTFDDVERPMAGYTEPGRDDVDRILRFGVRRLDVARAEGKRLLIHCYAGVSRSTAAALTILAHAEQGRDLAAANSAMRSLLQACENTPLPNELMIRHADEILSYGGALRDVARAQNLDPEPAAHEAAPAVGSALLASVKSAIVLEED